MRGTPAAASSRSTVIRTISEPARARAATWATVASPATSDLLRRLKAPMDQLVSIWVTDRDGVVRAGSQSWNPEVTLNPREFFQAHKAAPRSLYVGAPFQGIATARPSFAISQGRRAADGSFDGTIHTAVSPAYFQHFFAEASPPLAHWAVLLRDDGTVLAGEPASGGPAVLPPDAPIMRQIAGGSSATLSSWRELDGTLQDADVRS